MTSATHKHKWHERFLALAEVVSTWSKDPSTKVGAVIAHGNSIISLGYNGLPSGITDDGRLQERAWKHARVIHAEINAILHAHVNLTRATLYCTHKPCLSCASIIIQSGITSVYWLVETDNFECSISHFEEARVYINPNPLVKVQTEAVVL